MTNKQTEKQLMMGVGARLILLRNFHGMSQQDLADRLEVNRRFVSEWESGKRLIPTRMLLRLSAEFSISIAHFNPGEPPCIRQDKLP